MKTAKLFLVALLLLSIARVAPAWSAEAGALKAYVTKPDASYQWTKRREKEIGEGMARIYATDFTEQELKDLVTFYKTPLGQKLLTQEPKTVQASVAYMNQWGQNFAEIVNGQFRAEMRKRGKQI